MQALLPEYCVFIPSSGQVHKGRLYELRPISEYSPNAFVVLPYQNPAKGVIQPRFFQITASSEFSFASEERLNKIPLQSHFSEKEYIQKVKALKDQIQLGNIYELNFCIEFFAEDARIDPLTVFARLHKLTRAPYPTLVKLGDEFILSVSPELFLRKTGNLIESKPIKGTARRGRNPEEDEQLRQELFTSVKERTENVMAVDVARNDLSHFAKKGSVKVNKLYNIESFETVHQMVSTVSCELREGTQFEDIIRETFPMASMTGAPKIMAMHLIDQYESFSRNYYSGAMGFIDARGDFSLSVIIRSIFYNEKTKRLSLAVGGAITYLSEPEKEYEECMLKAKALFAALATDYGTTRNS